MKFNVTETEKFDNVITLLNQSNWSNVVNAEIGNIIFYGENLNCSTGNSSFSQWNNIRQLFGDVDRSDNHVQTARGFAVINKIFTNRAGVRCAYVSNLSDADCYRLLGIYNLNVGRRYLIEGDEEDITRLENDINGAVVLAA